MPPRCLTDDEVAQLLRATRELEDPRDHLLFLLPLSAGLRVHETVALNVGDVRGPRGIRELVELPVAKGRTRTDADPDRVPLAESVRRRIDRYLRWRAQHGRPADDAAPLFLRRHGRGRAGADYARLSKRAAQYRFEGWQRRLGWSSTRAGRPPYTFHCLRHTAIAAVHERGRDIELTRIFARHRSADTTKIYAHVRPERLLEALPIWLR
jgi:integrase